MSLLGRFLVKRDEDFDETIRTDNLGLHPLVSTKPKHYKDLKKYGLYISSIIFAGFILGISAKIVVYKLHESNTNIEISQKNHTESSKNSVKNLENFEKGTKLVNINTKKEQENIMNTEQTITRNEQNMATMTNFDTSPDYSGNKKIVNKLLYQAKSKELEGDINKAIILYKKAWTLDRNNINIMYKLALLNFRAGYYNNAIKYADEILKVKKDFIPAILIKGKSYEKMGMLTKAQAVLEEAFFYYPENKDLIETLAKLYEKQGDYLVAQDYYKMLADMGYVEGYLGLARLNEKLGNLKKAYKFYKKVYENPNISDDLRTKVEQKLISLEDSNENI